MKLIYSHFWARFLRVFVMCDVRIICQPTLTGPSELPGKLVQCCRPLCARSSRNGFICFDLHREGFVCRSFSIPNEARFLNLSFWTSLFLRQKLEFKLFLYSDRIDPIGWINIWKANLAFSIRNAEGDSICLKSEQWSIMSDPSHAPQICGETVIGQLRMSSQSCGVQIVGPFRD